MAITQDNIVGGKIKINGLVYSLVEIVHGGTGEVIWPISQPITYVIDTTTFVVHYWGGANWIYASATNYCYATADVKVMSGDTVVDTISDAVLMATSITGTYSSNFSINSSGFILGSPLGTTPVNIGTEQSPQGYYCTASFVYTPQGGSSSEAVTATVYQQYNRIESTVVTVRSIPDPTTVANTGGTVDCSGAILKDITYTSTSHDYSDHSGLLYLYIDDVYTTSISHNGHYSLNIGQNPYGIDIEFFIKVVYAADQEVYDTATITQYASVFTYDRPVIYGGCDDVPASGGWSYFGGYATQAHYINGTRIYPDLRVDENIVWSVTGYYGNHLHTTPTIRTKLGESTATCTANGQTAIPITESCYQEANEKNLDSQTEQRVDLEPDTDTKDARVSISADYYTSAGSPCPASGGSSPLRYSGSYFLSTRDKWNIVTTKYYIYTSGDPDTEESTVQYQGTWSNYVETAVDPDIYGGATWTHNNNDVISIDNRGTNNNDQVSGDARNTTYTAEVVADDRTVTASVTLYQGENTKEEIIEPIRSLEITTQGTIPAIGGTFNASYVSKESYGSYIYSSGATSGTPLERPITGEITCTNCSYNGNTRFNVSGSGTLQLTVPENTLYSTRDAVVLLDGYEGDSIRQEARAYTFVLRYGSTTVNDSDTLNVDVVGIYLYDTGTNLGQYTLSKQSGSNCGFAYDSTNQRFVITNISLGTNDWFQVYEESSGVTIRFTVYRAAATPSISADVVRLYFLAEGGQQTFKITSAYTEWSLSYNSNPRRPTITFLPSSGGSASTGEMEKTITVTAAQAMLISQNGTLTITPTAQGLSPITITVFQASQEPELE